MHMIQTVYMLIYIPETIDIYTPSIAQLVERWTVVG
jgi:hypothetical protein